MTFTDINDRTGFANGDKFTSDEQVREYFTQQNIRDMIGSTYDDEGTMPSQDELDQMAETVIENRWHYAESK
jgi:hypothetical protein